MLIWMMLCMLLCISVLVSMIIGEAVEWALETLFEEEPLETLHSKKEEKVTQTNKAYFRSTYNKTPNKKRLVVRTHRQRRNKLKKRCEHLPRMPCKYSGYFLDLTYS